MNIATDMNPTQIRALEIYTSSANILNEYKPLSFKAIAEQLKSEGFETSNSAVQRWSKKFLFENHLQAQIQLIIVNDTEKSTEQKALSVVIEKRIVDIKRNNELTGDCYELMELFTNQVAENYDAHGIIKRDDIKIIKDIATFTGGREDKLLDRLANSSGEKISSEDLKKQFEDIDIELEDIDVIDMEIENE